MLTYSDVQTLRQKGMTNRQILEMMAPVVPSAKKALSQIDADTKTPKWQVDARIGKMLDAKVPKKGASGLPYLTAVGLNKAQESFDQKTSQMTAQQNEMALPGFTEQVTEPGLMDKLGTRASNIGEAYQRSFSLQQDPTRMGLQIGGQMAGAANDVIGAGIGLGGKLLSAVTPDFIEKPIVDTVKGGVKAVAESAPGKAVLGTAGSASEEYSKWRELHPAAAADLEGAANIASFLPVGKLSTAGGKMTQQALGGVDDLAVKGSQVLKEGAEASVAKVLNPTTTATKQATQKLAPEILQRPLKDTLALTRSGMQTKAGAAAEIAGQAIDQAGPLTGKTKTSGLIDFLDSQKQAFMAGGKVVNEEGVKSIDNVVQIISQYGDEIDDETLRTVRRIFDTETKAAKKSFAMAPADASKVEMKSRAANKIRGILAEKYPDLAKLNKEYTFWSSLEDVLEKTNARRTGQKGAIKAVATAAGAVAGQGIAGSVTGAVAFRTIASLVDSPLWGLVSAKVKNQLAEALAKSDLGAIGKILGSLPSQAAYRSLPESK